MADDIVTRLRQEWEYGNNAKGCDYEMFSHAADEIERLQSDRDRWRNIAARLYSHFGGNGSAEVLATAYLLKSYEQAVRDGL